jgi:hypothetical protein
MAAMPLRVPQGQKGMRGVVLMPIKERRGFFGHAKVGEAPLPKFRMVLAIFIGLAALVALWLLGAMLMRGFLLN